MAMVKTQNGRTVTANRMKGSTPSQLEPLYIGVGTAAGPAAVTDTAITSEVGTTRLTATSSIVTTTTTNDTYRLVATYTEAAGPRTLTQAANFDNATVGSGTIDVKGDFATSVTLQTGDAVIITIDDKFV